MGKDTIKSLQEEYLQTKNQALLSEMYIQLVKLGFYLLKNKHYYTNTGKDIENIVYDVAQTIVMRLMLNEEPVINDYPSRYMKQAIYYASLPTKNNERLVNIELFDEYLGDVSAEENYFKQECEPEIDREVCMIITKHTIDLMEEDKEIIKAQVLDCLQLGRSYTKYLYKVKKRHKKIFIQILKEIKLMLEARV